MRKDILARISTAMEKGDVKLPTPKVTERTVDTKPALPRPWIAVDDFRLSETAAAGALPLAPRLATVH
jgi:hypothetical protein